MDFVCPACKLIGSKSQLIEIFSGYSSLGQSNSYYDEDGKYHYHNPNGSITVYRCSNGHESKYFKHNSCGICDYKSGETRFIKADEEDFMRATFT
jgi:hypothetical protein